MNSFNSSVVQLLSPDQCRLPLPAKLRDRDALVAKPKLAHCSRAGFGHAVTSKIPLLPTTGLIGQHA
jgi:hypothetical protein